MSMMMEEKVNNDFDCSLEFLKTFVLTAVTERATLQLKGGHQLRKLNAAILEANPGTTFGPLDTCCDQKSTKIETKDSEFRDSRDKKSGKRGQQKDEKFEEEKTVQEKEAEKEVEIFFIKNFVICGWEIYQSYETQLNSVYVKIKQERHDPVLAVQILASWASHMCFHHLLYQSSFTDLQKYLHRGYSSSIFTTKTKLPKTKKIYYVQNDQVVSIPNFFKDPVAGFRFKNNSGSTKSDPDTIWIKQMDYEKSKKELGIMDLRKPFGFEWDELEKNLEMIQVFVYGHLKNSETFCWNDSSRKVCVRSAYDKLKSDPTLFDIIGESSLDLD